MELRSYPKLNITVGKEKYKPSDIEFFEELLKHDVLSDDDTLICKSIIANKWTDIEHPNKIFDSYDVISNDLAGITIGFKIHGIIGIGKLTTIFRLTNDDRNIIVKISHSGITQNYKEYIRNEAKIMDVLKECPYTTRILSSIEHNDNVYIFSEHFESFTLDQFKEMGDLTLLGRIIINIIDGLRSLHSFGVAHRDIKPKNILCNTYGEIRYIDFDISCSESNLNKQKIKVAVGSPRYMDPVLLDSVEFTFDDLKKADYWSLGVMIFELMGYVHPKFNYRDEPGIKVHIEQYNSKITKFKDEINEKVDKMNRLLGVNFDLFKLLNINRDNRVLEY